MLAPGGTVAAASEEPLTRARPGPGPGEVVREDVHLPVEEDDLSRVVTTAVATDDGVYTVIVGQSLGAVEDSMQVLVSLLAVGYPFLLVVVGASTSWFVGRSLRHPRQGRRHRRPAAG